MENFEIVKIELNNIEELKSYIKNALNEMFNAKFENDILFFNNYSKYKISIF